MSKIALSLPEALKQAVVSHQAGNLVDAERLYRTILVAEPKHLDALHLLGVVEHQRGHHKEAIYLIEKALAIWPAYAEALNNRGNALLALNRQQEARGSTPARNFEIGSKQRAQISATIPVRISRTQGFCKKLKDLNLLGQMQARMNLGFWERMALRGFSVVDRAAAQDVAGQRARRVWCTLTSSNGFIPRLEDPELMLRAPPLGHPLQKYTVVHWDMGALFGRGRWRR